MLALFAAIASLATVTTHIGAQPTRHSVSALAHSTALVTDGPCQAVPATTIENIELGRKRSAGVFHLSNFQAVRSGQRSNIYYVAARVGATPGSDNYGVAVWALTRLDHSTGDIGAIWALPEIATHFTDWGDGAQTRARLGRGDTAYHAARRCVR